MIRQNTTKSLKLNFVMNVVLTMSSFIFPLITFPYVSRVLLPEGTGKVYLASSVIAYFNMFAQLGIPTYGIKACAQVRNDRLKLTRTAHELLFINIIMALVSYVLLVVALIVIPKLREERILYLIVSSTILLSAIGMEWLYQALEEYSYIAIRSLICKLVALIAMFLLVHSQEDYVIYGAVAIFAASASSIMNFINVRKHIEMKTVGGYDVKRHLKPVLVFFALVCTTTIYTNLDNVMLGFMKTDVDVGYYSAAVKIKIVLVSIITSLGAVLLPRASYYVEHGKIQEFRDVTKKAIRFVMLAAVPLSVFFILFARESILFLAGDAYEGSILPMQIIMPTLVFTGITNIVGMEMMVPTGKERAVLYSTIVGAVTDIILNIILIPRFAAAGAAMGTLVAELAVMIFQLIYIRKDIKDIFVGVPWLSILIGAALGGVVAWSSKKLETGIFVQLLISAFVFFGIYGLFNIKQLLQFTKFKGINIGRSEMKTIYMRNVLEDLWKKKVLIIIFIAICTIIGALLGYKKAKSASALSAEEQAKVETYYQNLENLENVMTDYQDGLEDITEQVDEIQKYVDESIYMNLDPENVCSANAQIRVFADDEETDIDGILNAIDLYVTQGGVRNTLNAADEDLKVKYWDDVLSTKIAANNYSVTVLQPTEEKAIRTIQVIINRINSQKPFFEKQYGAFDITEPEITVNSISDIEILQGQNNHIYDLTSWKNYKTDYENKVSSQRDAIDKYISEETPDVITDQTTKIKMILKYGLFGLIVGIVISIGIFILVNILGNKIRSGKSIKQVLGSYNKGLFYPEVGRMCIDIGLVCGDRAPAIIDLARDKQSSEVINELNNRIGTVVCDINTENGMKRFIAAGNAMIIVEAGKTTYNKLEEMINLCEKFSVKNIGCIIIE